MAFTAFSPWIGCRKPESRGCKNCYVRLPLLSLGHLKNGQDVVRTDRRDVLLDREAYGPGDGVFLCPLSDFLLEEADGWRGEIWSHMKERSDLDFFIQTKRITRLLEPGVLPPDWGDGYPNVYINATIDDPRFSEDRLLALVEVPARHRVIAMCPTTSPLDLTPGLRTGKIQQGYLIGEIGCGADVDELLKLVRPLRYEWVVDISKQFVENDVHFEFKATGTRWLDETGSERTVFSTVDQFFRARECGLDFRSSTKEFASAWGVDTEDWSSSQNCFHGNLLDKVFY